MHSSFDMGKEIRYHGSAEEAPRRKAYNSSIHTDISPPKPRFALRVAVIGNRRFGDEPAATRKRNHARAAMDLIWSAVFNAIGEELARVHTYGDESIRMEQLFSGDRPLLSILTSLAAGGDQIGSAAAIDAAAKQPAIELTMDAVVPFDEEDYPGHPGKTRGEFTDPEADEFRRLERQARQTICLAGLYAGSTQDRERAYQDARDMLLQNSDILIAIYDAKAESKKAGTVETVELAMKMGQPVIAVLVDELDARIAIPKLRPDDDPEMLKAPRWNDAVSMGDPQWPMDVQTCIRRQIVLPELLQENRDDVALKHTFDRLKLMSGGCPPVICTEYTFEKIFASAWKGMRDFAEILAPGELIERLEEPQPEVAISLEPYAGAYDQASKLAKMYMRTYRGGFVCAYLLAGLAVFVAVSILLLQTLWPDRFDGLMSLFSWVKVLILGILLLLPLIGKRERLQESAADFRYLAELLRPMQWLAPLGTYPPAVDLPQYAARHDPRRSWMTWLARALARATTPVSRRGCAPPPRRAVIPPAAAAEILDAARTEWIEGQVNYHSDNALRMRIIEEGLERMTQVLIWIVLVAAVAAAGAHIDHELKKVAEILTAITAILPAFIAGIAGVLFQSEVKRLASRSAAMEQALRQQQKVLEKAVIRLRDAGMAPAAGTPNAVAILNRLSAFTIGEAADWKVLYQVHEIHAA